MRLLTRLLACLAAASMLLAQPVAAQSILRDSETEKLLQDMVNPLVEAAGMPKGSVEVVLINDPTLNAFVAGGQRIYVHSGLINAADSANEVQGVLAHELGHIIGGHVIRFDEGLKKATNITILSLLVGIAAAAAGAGDAAMGALAMGQQAAYGSLLAFSRAQEATADASSVHLLKCARISGRGAVNFFRKLENLEYRYGYSQSEEAGFTRTHPLTGDRITRLEDDLKGDPAWNDAPPVDLKASVERPATIDSALPSPTVVGDCPPVQEKAGDIETRFQRVKAKLYGYLAKPSDTLRSFPPYVNTVPAHYARAYAYHKEALLDDAVRETDALLATDPSDPYFLELKGQVLLESGHPDEALAPLRQATLLTNNDPLIAGTFGHALVATEDPKHYDEAEEVLRAAVAKDRENPFAWYNLGTVYGAKGDIPRARLASSEQQVMTGASAEALRNAEAAEAGLDQGSPDWIRAQDVAMQARAQLEREKDRK
ncbi:M48 family metalloprotease [Altererythrobacter salegens]|uniref:M48 family metalloprotease n=1 Tax=Croceibacterium salegens TaxID=1737568 RepID=A0A6I4SWL2_9SPHN|nr:M48 family metalloprotease [Croceibacterium salegens]MXO60415.1 M48 family metalloprotease [Croceibacterium salegens]